jgi:hypothetical protein
MFNLPNLSECVQSSRPAAYFARLTRNDRMVRMLEVSIHCTPRAFRSYTALADFLASSNGQIVRFRAREAGLLTNLTLLPRQNFRMPTKFLIMHSSRRQTGPAFRSKQGREGFNDIISALFLHDHWLPLSMVEKVPVQRARQ